MILQFIGFFVVLGAGAFAAFWACREFYYGMLYGRYVGFDGNDMTEIAIFIVAVCIGCGLMYYAGAHAPFEISLSASLKS